MCYAMILQDINNSLSIFTMYLYWLIEATLLVHTRVLRVYILGECDFLFSLFSGL